MCADHLTLTKLRSVRNRTWEARSRWQNIGIELKLEKTDLDAINLKNGSDTDACFGEMLSMWLKQTRSQPTWSKMIRALKTPAVGFQELAEHIEMNSVTKQSVELHQFPHNNIMSEADEENQEELEGRLREQTRDIIREFNILKQKLFDTLEDYTVQRLNRYLKVYGAENFKSIDDVQNFIEKNSSFCDYEIVKYIIHLAGAEKDEQCLQEYEKCFEVYAQSRVYKIQCPSTIDASPTSPDSLSSKLCIKLDSEYDEVQRNPNKLKQLQCRLCNLLKIPVCKLVSIEPD